MKDSGDQGVSINWHAEIRGDELYDFCMRFAEHVEETIG